MTERRAIFCLNCDAEIQARLTNGAEVYPHRRDLAHLPFWKCDGCKQHVGCHHKAKPKNGKPDTTPLGVIATPALRHARIRLHQDLIDPLWQSKRIKRGHLYNLISLEFGRPYHSAELRSLDEARAVWRIVARIAADLPPPPSTPPTENQP